MSWHETELQVRFHEIDLYGIAWHGHYVAWMEEGRNALAKRFGLDAEGIAAAGYLAPVVDLQLSYLRPVRLGERIIARTTAVRCETASLDFRCIILGEDGRPSARGRTQHVLTDGEGALQFRLPEPLRERVERLLAFAESE